MIFFFLQIVLYWVYFSQDEDFKLTTELSEKSAIFPQPSIHAGKLFIHVGPAFLWKNYSASIYLIHFKFGTVKDLRIGSCLACVYRVMDARRKFGEHERSVRVARGAAESNSSFLSAL